MIVKEQVDTDELAMWIGRKLNPDCSHKELMEIVKLSLLMADEFYKQPQPRSTKNVLVSTKRNRVVIPKKECDH